MKVLYLSVWYPSDRDKMAGLFVQKHAEAVAAQGVEVRVNTWWPEADVVQLNVLSLKLGMVAYVLKRVFGIPYFIVEHWTGFLPISGNYEKFPRWKRLLLEEIAREADGIYPVSRMLGENMRRCGISNNKWGVINNVVDDFFYEDFQKVPDSRKQILYVGCFDEPHKNVKSLLRVLRRLADVRNDFCLTIVGTGPDYDECREYALDLNIPDTVIRWTGELPPEKVCHEMQRADFFVLTSRYENAPVVISECLAIGLPIVTTKSGGTPEMMSDDTGLMVEIDDDDALLHAMDYMLDHYEEYDRDKIRQYGKKYSFETVGGQLMKIYREVSRSC